MQQAAAGNGLVEHSGLATHKPHRLYLPKAAAHANQLMLCEPPALPRAWPYGPVFRSQNWTEVGKRAGEANEEAAHAAPTRAAAAVDAAYKLFANTAEKEIALGTGNGHIKFGQRGRAPQARWRSVVPPRVAPPTPQTQ